MCVCVCVCVCVSNIIAPKYMKQILIDTKGETDNNMIKVGEFNTPPY